MSSSVDGVRVEVLGPVRAWRETTELDLGATRQRAVFAVLAVRAGRAVSGAELIAAVWGQQAPVSAAGSVHTYVSGLRRALEPQRERRAASTLLTSGPAGYTLRVEPAAVDAVAFDRLLDAARRQASGLTEGDPVDSIDHALGLWRGSPLSGLPGPFLDQERDRLTEQRLAAIEQRAESLLENRADSSGELIAELSALTREYPLRERLRELLMLALHRGERRGEALGVFRDVRSTLVSELGIEPGAALRRLHSRILAQDPLLVAGRASSPTDLLSVLPAQATRPSAQFVGRKAELHRLRSLVDDVCRGRGGCAWIESPPGLGKSALLANALADIRGRGCHVGWAVADDLSRQIPLRMIHDCLGISGATEPAAEPAGWGRDDAAFAAVGRILQLVDDLCTRAPLVLVVDNIQRSDEASLVLWQRLIAATRRLPLLLVAAARPILRTTQLVRLRQQFEQYDGVVLNLRPLSGTEALALHESVLGAQAGPNLRDLVEHTIGIPQYLIELTESLVRDGALITSGGVAELVDSAGYPVPRGLVEIIGRHLDMLTEGVREMLRWAALLGAEFTVIDIAALTGKRPSDLLGVFEDAVAANVITDKPARFAFRHPQLRQVCYQAIPQGARAALHRQAAEALAGTGASAGRVAEQIAAAGVVDPWVLQWLTDHHDALAFQAPSIAPDLLSL